MGTPSLMYGDINLLDANQNGVFAAQVGSSFGAWQSITSTTTSLFLDGAVVTGDAAGNRTIVLKVQVGTDTRAELIAASELLIGEANRGTNVLVFDADDGTTPVVYETFRTAEPNRTDDESEGFPYREYTLTIPALPFARSNTRRTPSLSFPPGYGGSVSIIQWGWNPVTGAVVSGFSGHNMATEAARNFLQGIPIVQQAGPSETYVVDNAPGLVLGGMSAVSNASITSTSNQRNVVATAAGLFTAKSTTPQSTSANGITAGVTFDAANSADLVVQVGIEWFTSGVSIFTDWGTPTYQADNRPVWASSARPSAANQWGFRIRATATSAAQSLRISWVLGQALTFASYTTPMALAGDFRASFVPGPVAGWGYAKLLSTVNTGAQTHLQVTIQRVYNYPAFSIVGSGLTIKLHTAGGKWSAWYYRPDATEEAAFTAAHVDRTLFFPLSTPDAVSDLGAATLSSVEAVSVEMIGNQQSASYVVGNIQAGLGSGVLPPSTRGVVFDVDPILGSARSPAAVHASADTPLTDVVIQAVDPNDGPPLLQFASSVAIASAPHGYDGVYSIVGTRISGSDPVDPVITITQKQDGDFVASRALDGYVRPGGHYVDFGTVSLPLVHHSDENVGVSLTFAVTPTSASWGEVLVLNTNSPLMMLEQIDPTAEHVFIDEPAIETGIGRVLVGNQADRTDGQSPINPPILSLPFTVKAPGVKILTYSTSDGPNIELSYFDRWLGEPV